ncbi:hypothetical protein, partial [Clostridium sp. HCS.1]|uniref:hypothetical protein n=1 Tax=Clostridium sp. HCS.1 TaxID=3238594 RepID=UPI003A0FD06F
ALSNNSLIISGKIDTANLKTSPPFISIYLFSCELSKDKGVFNFSSEATKVFSPKFPSAPKQVLIIESSC